MKNLSITKQIQMNELYPCERLCVYDMSKIKKVESCLKTNNSFNLYKQKDIYYINYKGNSYYGKKRRYYTDYC